MRWSRWLPLLAAVIAAATSVSSARAASWYTLDDPIDPGQLTALPSGAGSQLLQPWRSSLVTRSAVDLQDAIGINFNVTPAQADDTARLLADSGVRRVRLEIGWSQMSYADPGELSDPAAYAAYMQAFRQYGLRPLILLNANSGMPGPGVGFDLTLTAPAGAGATSVDLDAGSAAAVVPGLTGIDSVDSSGYPMAAGVLITSVDGNGVATLSRPLPSALAAGPVAATTLRYEPFAPPFEADGVTPNPRFQATMAGWLQYVQGVTDFVKQAYGSDDFDVEVWNELSLGSAFLDEGDYYSPVPDPGATGDVDQAILAGTVDFLADPANGLTDVKVGDGFSNQTPYVSGADVPLDTAAIDKHLYQGPVGFPGYGRIFMPEYFLTGVPSDPVIRDLSPIETDIDGVAHGAATHPQGGVPPALWITEANLDAGSAQDDGMPASDIPEFQAKAALRYYTAFASAGAQAIDLFAATWPDSSGWAMIPQSFYSAVDASPSTYPGDSAGGPVMAAISRMVSTLVGAQPISSPHQLSLRAVSSAGDATQFGDGAPGVPTLYNRDVLAFFPFEVDPDRFVSAVYVMTRDLTHDYGPDPAPGQTPYDLPPEEFRLTIGGVDAADASVSLMDPLTGSAQPASIVARDGTQIVVQLAATDSPRMLTIDEGVTAHAAGAGTRRSAVRLILPRSQDAAVVDRRGVELGLDGAPRTAVTVTIAAPGGTRVLSDTAVTLGSRGRRALRVALRRGAAAWLRRHHVRRLAVVVQASGRRASGTLVLRGR